jgi:hypothetical protein
MNFFSLRHRVQTGSGVHPPYYPVDPGDSPWIKRPGRQADHSSLSSAGVKNALSYGVVLN